MRIMYSPRIAYLSTLSGSLMQPDIADVAECGTVTSVVALKSWLGLWLNVL